MKTETVDKEKQEKEKKLDKKEKNKIPKEVSQEILKKIFRNILKAIGIMIYFVVLNLAYNTMKQERLIGDIKVFAGVFLLIGILIMEKAYKKDSGESAISAIELICLSLHTLSIMHVITLFKYDFRIYLLTSSYVFSIYYVLKAIIIYTKERKRYLNSLSDVSEIVKEDEPTKKEAKKRNIENVEENKEEKEIKPKNKGENNSKINKTSTDKNKETKNKKSKTTAKEKVSKEDNIKNKKTTSKEIKTKNTEKKETEKESKKEKIKKEKSKKEKPKKEVKVND